MRNPCVLNYFQNSPKFTAVQREGTTLDSQSAIDRETDEKLSEITRLYNANKDKVVQKLLDRIILVKPELHRNLKKIES